MGNAAARARAGRACGEGLQSSSHAWIESPERRRQHRAALQRDLDMLLELPSAKQALDWRNEDVVQMRSAVHCLQNCMVEEEDPSVLRQFARRLRGLSVRGGGAGRSVDSLNTSSCSAGASCASTPKRVSFRGDIRYEDASDEIIAGVAADKRSSSPPAPVLDEPAVPEIPIWAPKSAWEQEAQASPLLSGADTGQNSFVDVNEHGARKFRGQVDPAELSQAILDLRGQLDVCG